MNQSRLDHFARSIASGLSRRRLLSGLLVGLPGAHLAQAVSSAKIGCTKIGKACKKNGDCCPSMVCSKQRCGCPRGYRLCDGACRDLSSDPRHCGACGYDCDPRQSCVAGVCLLIGTPVDASDEPSPDGDVDVDVPGAPPPVAG